MEKGISAKDAQAVATSAFSGLARSLTPKGKTYAKALIKKSMEKRRQAATPSG